MIFIRQNTTNNVPLTLNELATISPFDVLFEFTNDTTGDSKIFAAQDVSPATERYNRFNIIESTSENLYVGQVELDPVGYWSYTIYEMNVSSPPDLDPTNAIKILEVGKVLVVPNSVSPDYVFNVDENKNNITFE